ncbi:MAG: serine kinase [Prolixibacteraceae bacterium]|nr:serine kinase [Prolixibacteraceae bacterium]
MKVSELVEKLELKVYAGSDNLDTEITGGYVSDLLSDVMGFAREGNVWITLQNHLNVIAIASLKDLSCVILVKNIVPGDDVIEKANEEGIPLLGSSSKTFELGGEIYRLLL